VNENDNHLGDSQRVCWLFLILKCSPKAAPSKGHRVLVSACDTWEPSRKDTKEAFRTLSSDRGKSHGVCRFNFSDLWTSVRRNVSRPVKAIKN